MNITVKRTELAAALKRVKPAIGNSMPVLANVHLHQVDGELTVTATSMDTTIATSAHCVGEEGSALIPAAFLSNLAANMVDADLSIDVEDGTATITCGQATATTPVVDVKEWPRLDHGTGDSVELPADIVQAIRSVVYAASQDSRRPALLGVRFDGRHVVATDSYRLAVADLGMLGELPAATIPAAMLRSALADTEAGAALTITPHSASWDAGATTWTTRMITEEFPAWERLIDSSHATVHAEVSVTDLTEACKLMQVVRADESPIRLEWGDDGWLTVRRSDRTGSGSDVLDRIAYTGDQMPDIAFSAAWLPDMLRNLPDSYETLRLGATTALKPATVIVGNVTHLLMPVRVGT